MENNNSPRELAEIVETTMREFNEGMAHRENLSIRIGRRTTQIIRFGMTSMLMLGAALFYLIYILTTDFAVIREHMEKMSGHMSSMESDFSTVAGDINRVQKTLARVNENITIMPDMNASIGNMDTSLISLSGDMHSIVEQIYAMNNSVGNITANLQLMNKQFTDMNITVGHMAGTVNTMSKPMKMFPFQ